MITDPLFYAAAIPAVLLVGMSKGGFGGGVALLGVPLMSLVIPPLQAAGIMLPILIAMDMVGLLAYRRVYDRGALAILLPGAIAGIAIAYAMASLVTDTHVRLLVGAIALVFALNYWRKSAAERTLALSPSRPKGAFWGAMSGFTSFLAHAGGPPFQMYVLPLRLAPRILAGTAVVFFAVVNAVKLPPYLLLGQFSRENLLTSAVLLPLAPLATLLGVWLVKRVPTEPFYRFTYGCVFVVSLKLLWDGFAGLLGSA